MRAAGELQGRLITLRDVKAFKRENLNNISHALQSMNSGLKFGLSYRSGRSKYHRQLFESLAASTDVRPVPGYQKYDDFVRHRLYRSYNMIAAAEIKHANILKRTIELQRWCEDEDARERYNRHLAIQDYGEIMLVFALVPYYISSILSELLDEYIKIGEHPFPWAIPSLLVSYIAWKEFRRRTNAAEQNKLRDARRLIVEE